MFGVELLSAGGFQIEIKLNRINYYLPLERLTLLSRDFASVFRAYCASCGVVVRLCKSLSPVANVEVEGKGLGG